MNATRTQSEDGFSLMELVVTMFIMSLISFLVVTVYIASNQTAGSVKASNNTITASQTALLSMTRDVRNASMLEVSEEGNQLDIQGHDGTCVTWFYEDGTLSVNRETEVGAYRSNKWFQHFSGAQLVDDEPFFTATAKGVRYSFVAGSNASAVVMSGESYARLLKDDESRCF